MDNKAYRLINMVLLHEGGYANIAGDNGGETYRGISRKNFPTWEGWKVVDDKKPLKTNEIITDETLEELVRAFYYDNFYIRLKIHKFTSMLISGHLLCHGVNAGCKTSAKLLQKAINTITKANISVDGVIGDITITHANNENNSEAIAQEFINNRIAYYNSLASKNTTQEKFLKGWLRRVDKTTNYCGASNQSVLLFQKKESANAPNKGSILSFILKLLKSIILLRKR